MNNIRSSQSKGTGHDPQPPRRYNYAGRRARAAEGRRRVVAAAHRLFVEQGFARTTVAEIASAADVSAPTVYAGFTNKATLLKTCIDVALAGDDADTAVADRPLARWVYDTDDPRELLGRYAVMMGELASRAGPIYDVLVRAADSEPELTALLADLEQQRLRASAMVAEAIATRGGLPPGRPLADARDVIWISNAPELYVTLTSKRRWTTKRYIAWARNTLIQLIIEPHANGTVPAPPRTAR